MMQRGLQDWLWRLDCIERQLQRMTTLGDIRVYGELALSHWWNSGPRAQYGNLTIKGCDDRVARLKCAGRARGFCVGGRVYFLDGGARCSKCENVNNRPNCIEVSELTREWWTWYYLDPNSARSKEQRYWQPHESSSIDHVEKAIGQCLSVQPDGVEIGLPKGFVWGGNLLLLAMRNVHPLLQFAVDRGTSKPTCYLVPDYLSATLYAIETFRRMTTSATTYAASSPPQEAILCPALAHETNAAATQPGKSNNQPSSGHSEGEYNTPKQQLAELDLCTPCLDADLGEWVKNTEAARMESVTVKTLADYRRAGIRNTWIGKDKYGRIWRRPRTPASHPLYLKSSLVSQKSLPKNPR